MQTSTAETPMKDEAFARAISARNVLTKNWASIVAFVVMLFVGLWGLNGTSLNNDEHCTWWAVHLDWNAFVNLTKNVDAVLFPYYLFLRFWTALFGDTEMALRLPSVLAMALAAGFTANIGKRIDGPWTGLFAGLIFAAIPGTSYFAQDARPNAIAVATAVGATILFLRALDVPTSRRRWLLYGTGIVLTGLTHFVSLGVLSAHLTGVLYVKRQFPWLAPVKQVFRPWAITVLLSLLVLGPAFYFSARQAAQLREYTLNLEILWNLRNKLTLHNGVAWILLGASVVCWVRKRPNCILLTFWALVPPLFFFSTFEFLHIFRVRYFAFTLPAWALLAALACSSFKIRPWLGYALSVAFLLTTILSSHTAHLNIRPSVKGPKYAPYHAVASILSENATPDDVLIYSSNAPRQHHDRIGIAYAMREDPFVYDVLVQKSAISLGKFQSYECRAVETCISSDVERIWLLTRRTRDNEYGDIAPRKDKFIRSKFTVRKKWRVGRFMLILFTKHISRNQRQPDGITNEPETPGSIDDSLVDFAQ